MGRTIKQEKNRDRMTVYILLTQEEYEAVSHYCKREAANISDFLRRKLGRALEQLETEIAETGRFNIKVTKTTEKKDRIVAVGLKMSGYMRIRELSDQLNWPARHLARFLILGDIEKIKEKIQYEEDE